MSVDVEVKPELEVEAEGPIPWHGVLAPVDVLSGDNRIFNSNGAITYRNFPLPFKAMRKDLPGHDESVVVGNITNAWEENGLILGEGTFASNEDADYFIQLRKDDAMRGVSVDLDQAESQIEDKEGNPIDMFGEGPLDITQIVERVTKGRIASATICAIPAFQEAWFDLGTWEEAYAAGNPFPPQAPPADAPEAKKGTNPAGDPCSCDEAAEDYDPECNCEPAEGEAPKTPMFAAGGWGAPPETFTISEAPWDGSASRFEDDEWQRSCVVDRGESHGTPKERYAVPIKEPSGALSRAGTHAAAGRINQVDAPAEAIAAGKGHIRGAYRELGEEPPESIASEEAVTASMSPAYTLVELPESLTAAASIAPPKEWFENPNLEALTPLTVTDDGRVFGHAAGWGVCHIGLDKCVMAPKSPTQYAYFHTGALETTDGPIAVGNITMDTGHANLSLSARPATEHYDNTGTVVADVRAGEDKYGIWISGQVRPDLSPEQLRKFRAGAVSGDWRDVGGQMEMVAALTVNVPGFPVPRLGMAASGSKVMAMVAAAVVLDDEREHDQEDSIKELVKAAVREVREEDKRMARASALRAELNKDNPERRAAVLAALGEDE